MINTAPLQRELSPDLAPALSRALHQLDLSGQLSWSAWLRSWRAGQAKSSNIEQEPTVAQILERHDPLAVSRLAAKVRGALVNSGLGQHSFMRGYHQQYNMKMLAEMSPGSVLALSTHDYGYLREAAVTAIPSLGGAFSLALLFLRLNDWVFEVRLAAEHRFDALTKDLPSKEVLTCVELLLQEEHYHRMSEGGRICVRKLVERHAPALREIVWTESHQRTLRLIKYGLRTTVFEPDLEVLARKNPNPRVRAVVARALLTGKYTWPTNWAKRSRDVACTDRITLAQSLLGDPAITVQAEALSYLIATDFNWPGRTAELAGLLLRNSTRLATLAQYGLQQRGIDYLDIVRDQVRTLGPTARAAAKILARDGNASDGALLSQLAAQLPDERALPFLTVAARLGDPTALDRMIRIAFDAIDFTLARRAANSLYRAGAVPRVEEMIVAVERHEFYTRGLSKLLPKLSFYARLEVVCALESKGEIKDLPFQFEQLRNKMNRIAIAAKAEERQRLFRYVTVAPQSYKLSRRLLAIDLANVP